MVSGGGRPGRGLSWQGHDLDFTDVVFDGGDLPGAVFTGGTVSFQAARFVDGRVDFGTARFEDALVDFRLAELQGAPVNFGLAQDTPVSSVHLTQSLPGHPV